MINQPLITIITVVYNAIKADRLECFMQCIESVHDQSYENIEHIIVDGGSDDGTIQLIQEYENKGWIKYISEPDAGIYDAMNKGATLAKGEYLAFLNSDDFYDDFKGIEKCIKKLVKTNSDFLYAKAKIISEDNKKIFKNHLHAKPTLSMVFTKMPFSHQTMIVKTNIFKKLGMYDLKYKSASDYDFVLKMIFNKCKYDMYNYKLTTCRQGGFSLKNIEASYYEIADFYQNFYNKYYPLSIEDAKNIYLTNCLPYPVIKNVIKYLTFQNKIKLIIYQIKQKYIKNTLLYSILSKLWCKLKC